MDLLLVKRPTYGFGGMVEYLSKHYDDSAGKSLSIAEISRQWATLQRFTESLAHADPYAEEAAQGHGFAEDLLRVAASAVGWGFEASTGAVPTQGGMKTLVGLQEGFNRLT